MYSTLNGLSFLFIFINKYWFVITGVTGESIFLFLLLRYKYNITSFLFSFTSLNRKIDPPCESLPEAKNKTACLSKSINGMGLSEGPTL